MGPEPHSVASPGTSSFAANLTFPYFARVRPPPTKSPDLLPETGTAQSWEFPVIASGSAQSTAGDRRNWPRT